MDKHFDRCFLVAVVLLSACSDSQEHATDLAVNADMTAPAALPDFRFKWVDAFPSYTVTCAITVQYGSLTNGCGALLTSPIGEQTWGPLSLGFSTGAPVDGGAQSAIDASDATGNWETFAFAPNTPVLPMTSVVEASYPADSASDLNAALTQNFVITSLDVDPDGSQGFSAVVTDSDATTYTSDHYAGTRANLDAFATSEGAMGHVVTALAPAAQGIVAYAFSRSGDATVYDTMSSTLRSISSAHRPLRSRPAATRSRRWAFSRTTRSCSSARRSTATLPRTLR